VDMPRTLLVTNDFPPKVGGIQRTLEALVREFPPDRIAVLAPKETGSAAFDRSASFNVSRSNESFMRPGPGTFHAIRRAVEEADAQVILFGAIYPLALLGPRLARKGLPYVSAAHGFEYWLSLMPGTNLAMRYATSRASRVVVMCSAFIARTVRMAVPDDVPVSLLRPGADLARFRPDLDASRIRERYGLGDGPVIVCVSRLVERKGQDTLIRAMPEITRKVPGAALLVVGDGPHRRELETLARGSEDRVHFTGEVPEAELPLHYAAGDVFAMPCRSRLGGLEAEGWGNVFIEAAACGLPVVVGDSGGAKEALIDGETGLLVDGSDVAQVAKAVARLLEDRRLAASMGAAGRARVERDHDWPAIAGRLAGWLSEAVA
jgi:phosphatidylinositol alpha-1,6-mannosyltransferase